MTEEFKICQTRLCGNLVVWGWCQECKSRMLLKGRHKKPQLSCLKWKHDVGCRVDRHFTSTLFPAYSLETTSPHRPSSDLLWKLGLTFIRHLYAPRLWLWPWLLCWEWHISPSVGGWESCSLWMPQTQQSHFICCMQMTLELDIFHVYSMAAIFVQLTDGMSTTSQSLFNCLWIEFQPQNYVQYLQPMVCGGQAMGQVVASELHFFTQL